MADKYSTIIDSSKWDTEGLCKGIDLRRHVAGDLEEVGAFRAQEDYRRLVGPLENPYRGGLGPELSFMTVAVPECLPDRMEITSYALEFGFIHDGMWAWGILDKANSLQTLSIKISTTHLWTRWRKPWDKAVRLARSKSKVLLESVKLLFRSLAR